jgi:hypothetical protein
MSADDSQYHPPHIHADGFAFDDAGQRVPVTWPNYGEAVTPEENGSVAACMDLLRRLVCEILDGGHADSTKTRAAAAARLLNLFETDSAAAESAKVSRSTMLRALDQMRRALIMQQSPHIREHDASQTKDKTE